MTLLRIAINYIRITSETVHHECCGQSDLRHAV